MFLEGFIFRRLGGKRFCRFFSNLGSQNGVKTKKKHDLFWSLFRTFRVLATFGRFLSIFIDFGPHGTRKTAKNRRISAKKRHKFHSKKRFMNGGKRTCLTTSLATRYSPPGSHHQILTTRSSPPVPHHQRLTNHPHQPFQFNGRAVVPALPVQLVLMKSLIIFPSASPAGGKSLRFSIGMALPLPNTPGRGGAPAPPNPHPLLRPNDQ